MKKKRQEELEDERRGSGFDAPVVFEVVSKKEEQIEELAEIKTIMEREAKAWDEIDGKSNEDIERPESRFEESVIGELIPDDWVMVTREDGTIYFKPPYAEDEFVFEEKETKKRKSLKLKK